MRDRRFRPLLNAVTCPQSELRSNWRPAIDTLETLSKIGELSIDLQLPFSRPSAFHCPSCCLKCVDLRRNVVALVAATTVKLDIEKSERSVGHASEPKVAQILIRCPCFKSRGRT